jgi:tetratricopeptide (TPR) repeat protein
LGRTDILGTLGEIEARQVSVASLLVLSKQLDESRLAEAHYRAGSTWDFLGDYRAAVQAYDTSREAARQAGYTKVEALTLALIALDQNRLGDFPIAAAAAQDALALIPLVDEVTTASILNNVAVFYVESGDLARAAQLHGDQAAIHRRLGDRASEANSLTNLSYDYAVLGLYSLARSALESALPLGRAIGARRESAYTLLNLGLVHWRCKDANAALSLLEQAQSDLEAVGDTFGYAAGLSYLALVLEESGDLAGAQQMYDQANATFKDLGVQGYAAGASAGLARCALMQGNRDQAYRYAQEVWAHLQQHGSRGMEFPIWGYLTCAMVFESLDDTKNYRLAVDQGCQELRQRANQISDVEWSKSFLENVPEHRAIIDWWDRLTALSIINPTPKF